MLEQRARAARLRGQRAHSSSITGTVVGAYGLPAAGACVTAISGSRSVTATAAPSGTFTIAGLDAGSYTLEYRNCAAPGRYGAIWSGGAGWQAAAARVLVGAGEVRRVPVMMLPANPAAARSRTATWHHLLANASGRGLSAAAAAKTGEISGVVTAKGKRLRGVCITVFPVRGGGNGFGANTRKNGTYVVRHVPAGRYYVTFADELCFSSQNWLQQVYKGHNTPFGSGFGIGNPVRVRSGKATTGIDGKLRLGGEISGVVTTKSGRRLGGICVDAEGTVPGGSVGFEFPTNGNGTYDVNALFPGKYTVEFTIGCGSKGNYAPAAVKPIKITYGKRVVRRIALARGGVLAGTVRLGSSSGTPLAGICVQANGPGIGFAFGGPGGPGSGTTNAKGRYRLIGLGTATYEVDFFTGCGNNGNYTSATQYRHATAGKVIGNINAVLQVGAQISGAVTDTDGRELSGICINLNGPSFGSSPGATLSDGSYYVNQLSAGTYQLGFSTGCGNSGNYQPYWYDNQTNPSLATPIKLARGASMTIDAQMQPGASISGTITDGHGHKLTGVCVNVMSANAFEGGSQAVAFSEQGTYRASGLTPGEYLIDFGCGGSNRYADQWFPNAPDGGAASMISIPAGKTTGVSAVLQPAGAITGVVRGPSGKPLANVCISANSTKDFASSNVIVGIGPGPATNSRGAYRIFGLAAGRYRIEFAPCALNARYAAQWYRGQASQRLAKSVLVRAGRTTTGVNAKLRLGATITGRVLNSSGKRLNNICVTAYNSSTGQFGFGSTGKAGTYIVRGLATGGYTVAFSPCNFNVNLVAVDRHIKIVAPRTTRGVNARLVAGGSASGSVTVAASGGPAAQTCVELVSRNPANAGGFTLTGNRGRYLATGIAPGSYQAYFNDPLCGIGPVGLAPQWYNGQPTQATANKVKISVGQTTTGIDAALQVDGTITGTVLGPSSKALTGICVTAMPLTAGFMPVVAISGKTGGFTLLDMLPGRYKVEFASGCGATGYRTQWWKHASFRQKAKVITVSAASTVAGIDATLTR